MSAMTAVVLEKTVLFQHSPAAAIDRVRVLVVERSFRAGEVIFDEGDAASDVYLLKSGMVELDYSLPTRHDMTVRITTIHPGELFAWSALTGRSTLTARAYAIADSEAFLIPAPALREIMEEFPVFGYQTMNILCGVIARRLADTRSQLQWLQSL